MSNILNDLVNNSELDDVINTKFDFYNKLLLLLNMNLRRDTFVNNKKIEKIIDGIKNKKYKPELLNYLYNYMYQVIDVIKFDIDIKDDTLFIIEKLYDNKVLYSTIMCTDNRLLKKQTISISDALGILSTVKSVSFCLESAIDLVILNTKTNDYINSSIDTIILNEENNNNYVKIGFFDFNNSIKFPVYNVINLENMYGTDISYYSNHGLLQDNMFNPLLSSYTKTNLNNLCKIENKYLFYFSKNNNTFNYDQDIKFFISNIISERNNQIEKEYKNF